MLGWLRWFLARNGVALSVYMLGAVALWVIIMIVLPQLFMLDFSFRHNWQQMDPSKTVSYTHLTLPTILLV